MVQWCANLTSPNLISSFARDRPKYNFMLIYLYFVIVLRNNPQKTIDSIYRVRILNDQTTQCKCPCMPDYKLCVINKTPITNTPKTPNQMCVLGRGVQWRCCQKCSNWTEGLRVDADQDVCITCFNKPILQLSRAVFSCFYKILRKN